MLILTRKEGETIIIGDDVTLTIFSIKGHQVRIGINAPKEVSVHREEIYQRIQKDKLPRENRLNLHKIGECAPRTCEFCNDGNIDE